MPDPTDFVTDLPADFEIFGDAVDATVDGIETIANAALPETIIDAAGDLIYGSAADTAARLGIGTAGQVLKVNGTADAPEWGSVVSGDNFTLLNTGGTATTSGTTVTVSGISGQDKLAILFRGVSSTGASARFDIQFNSSTSDYQCFGGKFVGEASYNSANVSVINSQTAILVAQQGDNQNSTVTGFLIVSGANGSGTKVWHAGAGSVKGSSTANGEFTNLAGVWTDSSTITSVTIRSDFGTFDAGTLFVYGSA
jgi:hypothetical protein